MQLTSSDFSPGQPLPRRHAREGENVSPELAWDRVPMGTRSLALVMTDPDAPDPAAPRQTFTHWVLYNLSPDRFFLPRGFRSEASEGRNDWDQSGYGGPAPPIGRHRYFFRLLALDTQLGFEKPPNREELERACEGHILAEAELMGTYVQGSGNPAHP